MSETWVEEKPLEVIDRSDLELWSVCPRQAALIKSGKVLNVSAEMDSGNAVHDALSEVTKDFISAQSDITTPMLREYLEAYLLRSRPDIQADAIDAMRASAWAWCKFIMGLHFQEILKFDGGEGKRSGQIAHDFADLGLRITSEIDLLYAGPSKEVLHEIDYKSGHKQWTAADVYDSFQFQMHALLIFEEYPAVNGVEVQVWNTRRNDRTYRVTFDRDRDYQRILYRIRVAAETYATWRKVAADLVEAWPGVEKCSMCRAAPYCLPAKHVGAIAANPENYLAETIQLQANVEERLKILKDRVTATGRDIVLPNGDSFGFNKPKSSRKAAAAIYQAGKEE